MSVIRTCVSVIRTCVSVIRTCVSVIRTCVSLIRTSSGVEKNVLITDTFLLRMDRNGSQAGTDWPTGRPGDFPVAR